MILHPDEPPAFEVVNPTGRARAILLCDHAERRLPRSLGTLGVPPERLAEHIAWDIGAANVARRMAARLDAPLVLSGYSRLAIDCNRPLGVPASIPAITCGFHVPGNTDIDEEHTRARVEELFLPYHRAIERILEDRERQGLKTAVLSIHSFTPEPLQGPRPWHIGLMYRKNRALAVLLLEELSRDPSLVVGDNQPYQVTEPTDYGIPMYAEGAGRPGVLIEVRQDLIETEASAAPWADRLADAFTAIEPRLFA
jgi:predicted N-formylglutamate amidohydrolase